MEFKYLVTQVVIMLKKIQTVQNKSLKTLFNLKWDTSTNELHHNLKVFKVCAVFKILISEFLHSSIFGSRFSTVRLGHKTSNQVVMAFMQGS